MNIITEIITEVAILMLVFTLVVAFVSRLDNK
jgi:hypothetical protein